MQEQLEHVYRMSPTVLAMIFPLWVDYAHFARRVLADDCTSAKVGTLNTKYIIAVCDEISHFATHVPP